MDVWRADPARDAAVVAALRYAWAATTGRAHGPCDDGFTEQIRRWWVDDDRTVFVAGDRSDRGGVAGMITVHEYRRMPMPGAVPAAWGYVGHLFVLPAARRQGVGRALVERAQEEARSRDYRRLVLSPTDESVDLYRRMGFRSADELMLWTPEVPTS
ncbi:GNAT family N-acetyltransferase [Tsukamurella sp. 1534]|uniref:GNAT family N-acetyltransferase n=1 Tax=Tsukamurella sp. 1534 TaxID=1151061 RepID=UPI0002EEF78B|nr:GNAT family N-acetyltransferase [Tsukamurella sp. 1534]